MSPPPVLEVDQVSKSFGGIAALNRARLDLRAGEIHAVVGGNGAGKSTLMKILAGVHHPDAGTLRLNGRELRLAGPRDALQHGISLVFQELSLFPHRSVTANVHAGRERRTRWGFLDHEAMHAATARALHQLDAPFSPRDTVASLSLGSRQKVEIARTLAANARILILDEPNSALNDTESRLLFDALLKLPPLGVSLVLVSHRLDDVFALAHRITVLRDGNTIATVDTASTSPAEIVALMNGSLPPHSPASPSPPPPAQPVHTHPRLAVHQLAWRRSFGPVSFNARPGEIVGFAGLEGSGIDELFLALFGAIRPDHGSIHIDGIPQPMGSTAAALRLGWAMIPASRREEGLLMDASIARNLALRILDRLSNPAGLLSSRALRAKANDTIQALGIVARSPSQRVSELSGGNQQKVLLGRWLAANPSLLILNDPTRGVDQRSKTDIHQRCRSLAQSGMTLLVRSSEAADLPGLADRALVFFRGRIACEFNGPDLTRAALLHAMSGSHNPG